MSVPKLTAEQAFENAVVAHLLDRNGLFRAKPEDYDREFCLLPEVVLRFLQVTQPEQWASYKRLLNGAAEKSVLKRIRDIVERNGTLYLLRRGFDDSGHHFEMCFFKPTSGLNPELARLYEGNSFHVLHDADPSGGWKFSRATEESIDIGLFLNGLPIFAAELKNEVSGQTAANAVAQFKARKPAEPIFRFGRLLCCFAFDTTAAFIATAVDGKKTYFLPFNQGNDGGAGNPPSRTGFATGYVWERIWTKENILDLIQRFVQVIEKLDPKGRPTGKKLQIFPRYHQLETVRKLTAHCRAYGAGFSYLNQHSAGSGKTIEIATLANALATLHNEQDKVVFRTVIVLSDRKVIDRQLQRELEQFTQTRGMLENIERTSRQLLEALQDGKKIIVSTIQKFPVIVEQLAQVGTLSADSFAVIIDEAHSSQAGDTAGALNRVLSYGKLEDAKDADEKTWEEKIDEVLARRGRMAHVSFFAFTATPKPETLQLFKTVYPDGKAEVPFTLYTMRQAIEEKFILDVLRNYTTYNQYSQLVKSVKEDPVFDKRKATALLRNLGPLHPAAVDRKSRVIIDHFASKVMHTVAGKAKAMIVTRSRLHAVRYYLEVTKYLKELGNPFKVLVAFTDTVKDKETGKEYTEAGLNGFAEDKTAEMFELEENRILIVASKYQTGFNQPLLKAMYVDRKLAGVIAVQTLSRLNRTHPDKGEDVFVLDFENKADDIKAAFQPFYDRIALSTEVDPNLLYDVRNKIVDCGLFTPDLSREFCTAFFGKLPDAEKLKRLHAITDPVVADYKERPEDERANFKSLLRDYVKLYGFISQLVTFKDRKLEELYAFAGFVVKKLPGEGGGLPTEILNMSDLDNYKPELIGTEAIILDRGESTVDPKNYGAGANAPDEKEETLSKIIEELNQQFGTKFTEDDRVVIQHMEDKLSQDPILDQQLKVSSKDAVRLSFEQVAQDILHDLIESNFKFYKKVQDDDQISRELFDRLFDRYYQKKSP